MKQTALESINSVVFLLFLPTWTMMLSLEAASWASFTQRFTTS